jgi:WD40 repeat protein
MKYILKNILFLSFILSPLIAMEDDRLVPLYKKREKTNTSATKKSNSHAVLDRAINKKYTENSLQNILTKWRPTDSDMFGIVDTVTLACYPTEISDKTTASLYEKNNFFKQALDYFAKSASNDIKHVTYNTLSSITNPETNQRTLELNLLPLAVKKFVMHKAQEQIERSYDLILAHSENESINCFHVSASTGLAVTASDESIRLWNLNKGEMCLVTLPEGAYLICFSPDGSHIIGLAAEKKTTFKQWEINDSQLILTHTYHYKMNANTDGAFQYMFEYIKYFTNNLILLTGKRWKETSNTYTKYFHTLIQCNEDGTTTNVGSTDTPLCDGECDHTFKKFPYYAGEEYITTSLIVTKNNCRALYLCELAIRNHRDILSLKNIEQAQQYEELTDYEKALITAEIEKKRTELGKRTRTNSKKQIGYV